MSQIKVFNKTKIIATVGPASNSKDKLEELIYAGVDVFRLNFSHGTHEDHARVVHYVRELNKKLGTHVCLLQDLQGPKIRVGEVEKSTKIQASQEFIVTTDEIVGNQYRASTSYLDFPKDVNVGDKILIDDGKLELRVKDVKGKEVITEVLHGGKLKSNKGINLPYTNVSAPSLTKKDLHDVKFGIEHEVEWIALSFVRKADDIRELREILTKAKSKAKIIAKIEKPEAMDNIDEIIEVTDAVMVARGDLGVEILSEEVPLAQKMIVKKCNLISKPVIIATQMMESMIENPRPTRAETNDVANAVMDGADTLMLSAETAAGNFPVEVVKSMVKTILTMEKQSSIYFKNHHSDESQTDDPLFYNNTLVRTSCVLAQHTKATALVGMTVSGYNAFRLAANRPKAHIFIFTPNKQLLNTLSLVWGVRGYYYDKEESTDQTFSDIEEILCREGHLKKGDVFITTASMPIQAKGRTNSLKINIVE